MTPKTKKFIYRVILSLTVVLVWRFAVCLMYSVDLMIADIVLIVMIACGAYYSLDTLVEEQ